MNKYLAIARRDFKQNPWLYYLYVFMVAGEVLSPNYPGNMMFSMFVLLIPLLYAGMQAIILKASFAYTAGFMLPEFRNTQLKYSLSSFAVITVISSIVTGPTPAMMLALIGVQLLLGFISIATINDRVAKVFSIVAMITFWLAAVAALFAGSIEGMLQAPVHAIDWAIRNSAIMLWLGLATSLIAFCLIPWVRRLAALPKELNPSDIPAQWKSKHSPSHNEEVMQKAWGAKWLLTDDNLRRLQKNFGLMSGSNLLEKGIFSKSLTSTLLALFVLFVLGMGVAFVLVNELSHVMNQGITYDKEASGVFLGFICGLFAFLINITLCSEALSSKHIMARLLLLDNAANRQQSMGRVFWLLTLRYIRFYVFMIAVFLVLALVVGLNLKGVLVMLKFLAPSLMILPMVITFCLWVTANLKVSPGSRYLIPVTVFLLMLASYLLSGVDNWFYPGILLVSLLGLYSAKRNWSHAVLEVN